MSRVHTVMVLMVQVQSGQVRQFGVRSLLTSNYVMIIFGTGHLIAWVPFL